MTLTLMRRRGTGARAVLLMATAAFSLGVVGCHIDMWEQEKVKAQAPSDFFANGQGDRPLPAGTVARAEPYNQLWAVNPVVNNDIRVGNPMYTGVNAAGKPIDYIPDEALHAFPSFKAFLQRGQSRFNIFCTPCHSKIGDGKGMIALRGFALSRPPASYHTDRLRKTALGQFYLTMTNGYGAMFSYAARITPVDRWAIAAYIRVLQRSEYSPVSLVPPDAQSQLGQTYNAPAAAPVQE
ncbi:MAG: cytochrome c [Armatimonadetes bacterium]|nr:cytochrome c [Armatimonadota bacterium]MDE2206821.1 cytochrome c [Armatimonadota bacterium]